MCGCGSNCGPGTACYIIMPVPDPVITPAIYSFSGTTTISISCGIPNAKIYYTLDGSTPNELSAVYSGPIQLTQTTKVKAIALLDFYAPSNVVAKTYTKQISASRIYWGAASNTMLTGPEVMLLQSVVDLTPYRTYTFGSSSTVNDYFYFWWPVTFGPPRQTDGFRDTATLSPVVMATDVEGFNTNRENGWWYKEVVVNGVQGKLFRSYYQLGGGGSFPIQVLPPVAVVYRADTTDLTSDTTSFTADYSF